MKRILLILIIISGYLFAEPEGFCGTEGTMVNNSIPTNGTIKIYFIFAQFKNDDRDPSNTNWVKDTLPSWAPDFVNSSITGSYPYNNLSKFYNDMSDNNFNVVGEVYDQLVITEKEESEYNSIGRVNREIIEAIDSEVDFSEYDLLSGTTFAKDGFVDLIFIVYRNIDSLVGWSGYAQLILDSLIVTDDIDGITGDTLKIKGNTILTGGAVLRGGIEGKDYLTLTTAHELGHYLFGAGHIDYISRLGIMSGGPAWNSGAGMHSWEKHHLGWLNYTDISPTSDSEITNIADYLDNNNAYRLQLSSNEWFVIENHQQANFFDKAGQTGDNPQSEKGVYIYHIRYPNSYPPNIDVECADGNYDFSFNNQTYPNGKITRGAPNPDGEDEMSYDILYNYYPNGRTDRLSCYKPLYDEDAVWGDDEDAFDTTFNNVFSPKSNPPSTNTSNNDFSLEVTGDSNGVYTMKFYVIDPYAGSPSKPQGLSVENETEIDFGDNYTATSQLEWFSNDEPDLDY
ncbi:MAG: hypothetical protein C4543_09430 [Ignavibacteriales bacterium]|nr:MAG: hypothetical protein C4543_09430 [Ignavibacteriales bacterium]